MADLFFGAIGFDKFEPVAVRALAVLVDDDFDLVAILESLVEGSHLVIDQGSAGFIADLSVDGIGKIDGSRVFWQIKDIAIGREDKDTVLEDIEFDFINEFIRVFRLALDIDDILDPVWLLFVAAWLVLGFVMPMGGNTKQGFFVHFLGADLEFGRLVIRAKDGRMQALVAIGLGHGDVVFDAIGFRLPERVDDA